MLQGDCKDRQIPLSEWFLETCVLRGGGLVSFLKDYVPHQCDRLVPHGAIFSHFRRVIGSRSMGVWGTAGAVDELACGGCLTAVGKRFPWFLTKPGRGFVWWGAEQAV